MKKLSSRVCLLLGISNETKGGSRKFPGSPKKGNPRGSLKGVVPADFRSLLRALRQASLTFQWWIIQGRFIRGFQERPPRVIQEQFRVFLEHFKSVSSSLRIFQTYYRHLKGVETT